MRARKTAVFAAIGCLATLGLTAPAAAADAAPTISAPASRTGYGTITITGTAPAGATVELYESAYKFNDFYKSPDYSNPGGFITTTASTSGQYSMTRLLDSGFRFYVMAGGVASNRVSVAVGIVATMTMTASNGTVGVSVAADPGQPGLQVHVQRNDSGTWSDVAGGYTTEPDGIYTATLNSQGSGSKTYRAVIDADSDNNLLAGSTTSVSINVGSGTGTGTPTTPTTPPKPTTPVTPAPKAGAVLFSKIVYNSPGKDTGSNTSLNGEYVRLLNKTKATINLKGWTVRDAAGHVYKVGTDQRVAAGKYVYLHTGKGTNGKPDSRHRYWNRTGYVWNNGGDTAYLRTAAGKTIDSCRWTSDKGLTYC